MEPKQIEALLLKFYEGLTSSEEERLLTDYFSSQEVDEAFTTDREVFLSLRVLGDQMPEVPAGLDDDIKSTLAPLQQRSIRNIRPLYWMSSAAAIVLLIAGSLFFLRPGDDLGTISDPQLAYNETTEALDMVARYFGQGTRQLASVAKFNEALEPLSQLGGVDQANQRLAHLKKINPGLDAVNKLFTGKE